MADSFLFVMKETECDVKILNVRQVILYKTRIVLYKSSFLLEVESNVV